jgi:hypothetical protein
LRPDGVTADDVVDQALARLHPGPPCSRRGQQEARHATTGTSSHYGDQKYSTTTRTGKASHRDWRREPTGAAQRHAGSRDLHSANRERQQIAAYSGCSPCVVHQPAPGSLPGEGGGNSSRRRRCAWWERAGVPARHGQDQRPRPPQKSHKSGSVVVSPQKPHGQNGIIWHTSTRMLQWKCQPKRAFAQVNWADSVEDLGGPAQDKPSCKR